MQISFPFCPVLLFPFTGASMRRVLLEVNKDIQDDYRFRWVGPSRENGVAATLSERSPSGGGKFGL